VAGGKEEGGTSAGAAPRQDRAAQMAAAVGHHRAGRLAEAEALYRRLLAGDADDVEALVNLGALLRARRRVDEAVACLRRAIAREPAHAGAHNNLGNALRQAGDLDGAAASFRAALAAEPGRAELHCNLAGVLLDAGRLAEAEASLREALRLAPGLARAHYDLGRCLARQRRFAEAVDAYQAALRLDPENAKIENDLGNALFELDRLEEAASRYERAARLDPALVPAHVNAGNTFFHLMRIDAAVAGYERALAVNPAHGEARLNRALALLVSGRFREGFAEYEWRWRHPGFPPTRTFDAPPWDGAPLAGRTILLHAEQGIGDTIQFVRYAPLVKAGGGRVVLECQPPLASLLAAVAGVDQVVGKGDALPPFDVHAPLLSLPRILGTAVDTIPAQVPYLRAPAGPAAADGDDGRRRVGVAWAGNPANVNDRNRSLDPGLFAPVAEVPGWRLVILQVGPGREAIPLHPFLADALDLGERLPDFAATARAVARLDLVIAADTALAHLAGAMARPVWTLVPFRPDWRWLIGRDDSPWYPTMRLFRQRRRGDWQGVMREVAAALAEKGGGERPA
jgi:tetratricopeptide (TPR) repeat protein